MDTIKIRIKTTREDAAGGKKGDELEVSAVRARRWTKINSAGILIAEYVNEEDAVEAAAEEKEAKEKLDEEVEEMQKTKRRSKAKR